MFFSYLAPYHLRIKISFFHLEHSGAKTKDFIDSNYDFSDTRLQLVKSYLQQPCYHLQGCKFDLKVWFAHLSFIDFLFMGVRTVLTDCRQSNSYMEEIPQR